MGDHGYWLVIDYQYLCVVLVGDGPNDHDRHDDY